MITDQVTADRRSSPRSDQPWPDMADIRSTMTEVEEYARTHIMQRPVVAVIAAVGFGYLIARLFSRGAR